MLVFPVETVWLPVMAHNFPFFSFRKNEINKTWHLTIAKIPVHLTYHLQMKVVSTREGQRGTFRAKIEADEPGKQDSARGRSEPRLHRAAREPPGMRGGSPGRQQPQTSLFRVDYYCHLVLSLLVLLGPSVSGLSGAGALPIPASDTM